MSLTNPSTSIEILPNEILTLTLTNFSVKELLPVAYINHRFHSIVTQLLHRRLLEVASLPGHDLMLECYHPSARLSTPSLACHYLGIKQMSDEAHGPKPSLSILDRQQYASFRPAVAEEDRRSRRRRWASHHPNSENEEKEDDSVTEDVYLDEDQLFCQLCAKVHVVKPGPRAGLFVSHVNVFDGVIRLWRDWLARMSGSLVLSDTEAHGSQLIWADSNRTVGIKFHVTPGPMERMPVLSGPDDLPPISYKMLYLELLVPASELLLAMERSAVQEISHTGKAIVIASM